jgi:hypothetical protein
VPYTFAYGFAVNGSVIAGGQWSAQFTVSFPSWNPLDWRYGVMESGSVGIWLNGEFQGSFLLSASNALSPEELAGWSGTAGLGVNGGVLGAGVSAGNLNAAAGMANLYGHQPTIVNVQAGLGPSVEPVEGGVMWGKTWAASISPREIVDLVIGTWNALW